MSLDTALKEPIGHWTKEDSLQGGVLPVCLAKRAVGATEGVRFTHPVHKNYKLLYI